MKKIFHFSFILFFVLTYTYGQSEIELYKRIYKTADSLKAIGKISTIDTVALYKKINELDKKHPAGFFEASTKYLINSKFNEAAFTYYLGLMRYRYYNSVNPDYQASGDGALLASLKYTVAEPINMYLKTDIENFVATMKHTLAYYEKYDFTFFSKDKNIEKYNAQAKSYHDLISELESNKKVYKKQWNSERKTMEKNINQEYKELKKQNIKNDISPSQSILKENSIEFCGKYFSPPSNCETFGNMIKCNEEYVLTWIYEPVEDLPRHRKELLEQINEQSVIKVSVLNSDLIGYLSKVDTAYCMYIIDEINGHGTIINLWLNKNPVTTSDLPEYVRQFITIR